MNYEIIFHREADRELTSLYTYIADKDGPERAWAYVLEIREFCDRLRLFPKRGTERREIGRGVRTVGFKRRCSIVFKVAEPSIIILGIFYAGRAISADMVRRRLHQD